MEHDGSIIGWNCLPLPGIIAGSIPAAGSPTRLFHLAAAVRPWMDGCHFPPIYPRFYDDFQSVLLYYYFFFLFFYFYLIWFFWLNGPWFIVTFTSSLFLLFRFIVMIVYYCWFVLPFDGWDRVTCFDFHHPFIVHAIANSIANANICVCPHVANPTLNLFNLNR